MAKLSYHDVVVTVDGEQYCIRDNYAYELACTRVGGWQLWWRRDGKERLIGGEYDSKEFRIEAGGNLVCGRHNVSTHATTD